MKSNKIKVNIAGNQYTIIAEKSEKEVFEIADFVSAQINEIAKQNYRLSPTMAATLVALNISSDLFDLKKELEMIKKDENYPIEKQEELLKEKDKIESKNNNLEKELELLKKQNSNLVEILKNMENRYRVLAKNSVDAFNEVNLKSDTIVKLKDDIIKIKDEYIKKIQQLNKELKNNE